MGLFGKPNKNKLSNVYADCKKLYIEGKLEKAEKHLLPFSGQHPDADFLLSKIQSELGMRLHDRNRIQNSKNLLISAASKGHKEAAQRLAELFNDKRFLPQEAPKPAAPAPELTPQENAVAPGYEIYESACELYEEEDYEAAFELFLESANMGYGDAAYNVAVMYLNEEGTECDPEEALYWAEVAKKAGAEGAQKLIDDIQAAIQSVDDEYEESEDEEDDSVSDSPAPSGTELFDKAVVHHKNGEYEEAAKLFAQAANMGVGQAAANLAVMYVQGKGVKRNLYQAALWAQHAVDGGAPRGRELLDKICQYIKQEEAEAEQAKPKPSKEELLRREFFENYKPVDTFDAMVHAHRMGDKAKAKALMNELAAKGDTYAAKYACVCDDPQAYHNWLNQAFLNGHHMSVVAMGIEYLYGATGKQELGFAAVRASDGEEYRHPYAAKLRQLIGAIGEKEPLSLGHEAYRKGDYKQAYKHFLDAANVCSDEGTYFLAHMLLEGKGVGRNTAQALMYLRQLAGREYTKAMVDLAKIYFTGNGDIMHYNRARYWADQAGDEELEDTIDEVEYGLTEFRDGSYGDAMLDLKPHIDSGNMDAAYRVGVMYRDGLAVAKDAQAANLAFNRLQSDRCITFGSFVDPRNNRVRPLTWRILELDKKNRRMLLLCDYVLDRRPFSSSNHDNWKTSSLRKWLNSEALKKFFTPWEQKQILSYNHDRANDNLWLPDRAMIDKYFAPADWSLTNSNNQETATLLKKNADATGIWFPDKPEGSDSWWVDIPSKYNRQKYQFVYAPSHLSLDGSECTDSKHGPRPMMWIQY